MRRYWFKGRLDEGQRILIQGDTFHHIFQVCRTQPQEIFELLGIKEGTAVQVQVETVQKKQAYVRVVGERPIEPLPFPRIVLNLCVPRFPILDGVVEKAVELGVWRMQLLCNQFSFIRDPSEFSRGRLERLNKIVLQATQQTGRGSLMEVRGPLGWTQWCQVIQGINRDLNYLGLMAYESLGGHGSLKSTLSDLLKIGDNVTKDQGSKVASSPLCPQEIWILVGSEGGFSFQEVEEMKGLGWRVISLGSQILRVETACVVVVTSLKYELGQL
ncbi:MAG: 16S rRNA (uracil(1498)-N(3))-methyltransferase [Bdellovibrionaceae bacterium]|nr:16S rRNA (uracil(1498)-N(3))-methyltransferase [Pseudobdellovibrionaceae bacterium]MDW8190124.1 16S rRNA (uracil(1498)-N(3))-methyltransferase [Pseudobdellovibrionaceae bacterium]